MNPLMSVSEYEHFIYTLPQQYYSIRYTTLTVVRRGATIARVIGDVQFQKRCRLTVREKLSFAKTPGIIDGYGYEIFQGDEILCWYDSQPHPNVPRLQSTNPHHKHIYPDIKHNRIPAAEMSFTKPNLPVLIKEIEKLISSL